MASLKEYLAYVGKHGIARQNRFEAIIPLPELLIKRVQTLRQTYELDYELGETVRNSSSTDITKSLTLSIKQAEMPGKALITTDVKYNSDSLKIPYNISYENQPLVFTLSADLFEKHVMDEWINLIHDPVSYELLYFDDYTTNMTLNHLDSNDKIVAQYLLKSSYPMTINPIPLSSENDNQPATMNVIFAFNRWERVNKRFMTNNNFGNTLATKQKNSEQSIRNSVSALSQTPLGKFTTPFLSNPAIQSALAFVQDQIGIDLEGEAVQVYNQLDNVVRSGTTTNINQITSIVESIKASTILNDKIEDIQKSNILNIINGTLTRLKGI